MSEEQTEGKRDRVRRLLIQPLTEGGMRSRRGVDKDKERAMLDRICDEAAHLSDEDLKRLLRWCEIKGEGADKCFWPPFVAIAQFIHGVVPRPVEDLPELASWFGSVEGPKAARVPGLLAVTLKFIERHRRPPIYPGEKDALVRKAKSLIAEVQRAEELRDCGRMYDAELLSAVAKAQQRAEALVKAGEDKRSVSRAQA